MLSVVDSAWRCYPVQSPSQVLTSHRKLRSKSCLIQASSSVVSTLSTTKPNISTTKPNIRRPQNVDGDFYVDHRCIDCDVCRWMAPDTFKRAEGQSAVARQPDTPEQRVAALQALISCPVNSIHTEKKPSDVVQVHSSFPLPIDEKSLPGVYHCGYHADKSFGAASYFVRHPRGNILVDSPSFNEKLATKFEALGGVRHMFLSHIDDVADHDKWARRFSCERVMHIKEIEHSTAGVEIKLEGEGPWNLHPDVDVIFTPGHTQGSICLFYKPLKVLFTGDHLFKNQNDDNLNFSKQFNFYSVEKQLESIKALLPLDFIWILPGHGRRKSFDSTAEKNLGIETLLSKP